MNDPITPSHATPGCDIYTGDARDLIPSIPQCADRAVDLIFADPPFNIGRDYGEYHDRMPQQAYEEFTRQWLDLCRLSLRPGGSLWVNILDEHAAEVVVHLKQQGMHMRNWCIWHYRFGQNTSGRFVRSKTHALWFVNPGGTHTWNARQILEPSDRAAVYSDPRTMSKKDGMPPGMRVPMDVWYGKFWGRIQGNNAERRHGHDNQLPEVYLERVVRACSNEGDLVMDPFLGSGTTGVIAHALNRRFIGIDIGPSTARSAFERILSGPARPLTARMVRTPFLPAG